MCVSHNITAACSGCAGTDVCITSMGDDCWAVLVVTPIMRRAQHLESSQEIIFVDSTASCDVTKSTATVMLTATKAGAVPIAVLIHSSQTKEGYGLAFHLLKQRYPLCFGNKEVLAFLELKKKLLADNCFEVMLVIGKITLSRQMRWFQ